MNWLRDHAFVAAWLSATVALIALILRSINSEAVRIKIPVPTLGLKFEAKRIWLSTSRARFKRVIVRIAVPMGIAAFSWLYWLLLATLLRWREGKQLAMEIAVVTFLVCLKLAFWPPPTPDRFR